MESRDVTGDPAAMVALAHPVRLAVLELLGSEGPLTASEAGRLLGQAPGNMSWHLRLLARHGFVTEAEGRAGRRRPWRLTSSGTRWDPEPTTVQERAAADALLLTVAQRAFGQLRAWLASRYASPPEWQRAAEISDWTLHLTADETKRVGDEIQAILEPFGERLEHPEHRPPGAIAVRAFIALHPQQSSRPGPGA